MLSRWAADADMAELADALVLGSSVHDVQVQVLLSAPSQHLTNLVFLRVCGVFCFDFVDVLLRLVKRWMLRILDASPGTLYSKKARSQYVQA